ncbi:hypothetical protein AMS68_006551 [Peltaster fructicola]|uniref:chitin synthase n=1 Tax=Peltaster fructicola TaxID=286661 RepID=A0A6H0Y1Z7_9PEZI|nr:hypothetical protein AMS68_006551 [Peltaster fructicola]
MPSVSFNSARDVPAAWPVRDVVYVSIVGLVMLAALLEWMLWLLAFTYCLVKAFMKADDETKWSTRTLAIINMVLFVAMRLIFLPIMVFTLPLPPAIVQYFPQATVTALQWFAFVSFAGLLTLPWLLCVYQLVTHDIGRRQRIKAILDENSAPKVVIIMPCYNEEPEILLRTVDSLVDCDYPSSAIHIFLSFDGDQENELYLNTIDKLGIPLTLKTHPCSIDVVCRDCRITVSRFKHGGKRNCQKNTFRLVDRIYENYLRRHDDMFVLFIDSDCILDKYCLQSFLYEMELKPGSKRNVLAQTGVITSTTTKNTLLTVLQDMEYIHGQLFERTVESGCGAVTCLPGALTILRFSAFRNIAKYYFADQTEQSEDIFDYSKKHLGEDRWMTHLFMVSSTHRYQIQMNTGAFCKTEAVQTFKSLLKQRRRWFLGFITNEAVMLCDFRLWKRYPALMIIRLAQNTIRTTALLFFIMVISILTTSQKVTNLPVGFIGVSLGLNWALMIYFGARLGRYKIMLFPLMFVINPFINWLYMVYGIFTAGQRTWGGPRADASKTKCTVSPSTAPETVRDDLDNIRRTSKYKRKTLMPTLLPANRLQGRFAPVQELPGGWFQQVNGSGALAGHRFPRKLQRRSRSGQSWSSQDSVSRSPVRPRRVESLVKLEEHGRQAEHGRKAEHKPAEEHSTAMTQRSSSRASMSSTDSVPLHFSVPRRWSHSPPRCTGIEGDRQAGLTNTRIGHDEMTVQAQTHYGGSSRAWSDPHKGCSPLARKSFTRLAADQKTDRDKASLDEPRGRARRRPSVSTDARGRRRLRKQSRSTSKDVGMGKRNH